MPCLLLHQRTRGKRRNCIHLPVVSTARTLRLLRQLPALSTPQTETADCCRVGYLVVRRVQLSTVELAHSGHMHRRTVVDVHILATFKASARHAFPTVTFRKKACQAMPRFQAAASCGEQELQTSFSTIQTRHVPRASQAWPGGAVTKQLNTRTKNTSNSAP